MAYVTLSKSSLAHNYKFLNALFDSKNIEWAPVVKLLCGNRSFLNYLLSLGREQVCDSRLKNLAMIKELDPERETIYIKPPAKYSIPEVVRVADVSFNTEFATIKWLSDEAKKQGKVHKILIMIELGDLREGIMGDSLIDFYQRVFQLPNIEVAGIGANLNCLSGVMPSKDKLIQLSLYEQLIEAKFDKSLDSVSGGSSVMVPLLMKEQIPKGINHFRVGESLFLGNNLFDKTLIDGMCDDTFLLHSEIIEITEKPKVPYGEMQDNPSGERAKFQDKDYGKKQKRAILDIGLLDISKTKFLEGARENLTFIGASSDMLVVDVTDTTTDYKVGDDVSFKMSYMGALRVMNSHYIEKRLID